MKVEFAKLWYIPLPRWIFAVVLVASIAAGGVLVAWAPDSADTYRSVASVVASLVGAFAATVLGVWSSTLEFSAGTLQRTLTAESDRNRVLFRKLVVLIAATVALAVVGAATAGGLADYATSRAGVYIDSGHLARLLFGSTFEVLAFAVVGFGFGLITRSIGGGITFALAFTWVLNGALGIVPGIGRITFSTFADDMNTHITGDTGVTENSLAVAIIGVIAWLLIIVVPGWIRFTRGDLK
jgi:ABC-2 type transport system permease protein